MHNFTEANPREIHLPRVNKTVTEVKRQNPFCHLHISASKNKINILYKYLHYWISLLFWTGRASHKQLSTKASNFLPYETLPEYNSH